MSVASDKVQLEGLVFYGFHGDTQAEREVGQRFVVDLEVTRDLSAAGRSDHIRDTVSYVDLYKAAKEVVEGPSRRLLENVAETIAQRVLEALDVESITVKVKKPQAPIKGSILAHAAVEITRQR